MKPIFLLTVLAVIWMGCRETPSTPLVIPGHRPEADEGQRLLEPILRYTAKMPDKADPATRFDTVFDEHYRKQLTHYRVDRYHEIPESGDRWLLVSRIAPSIQVKRVSTGIHYRLAGDSLAFYHEVFRTWKLPEEELLPRADSLFARMVAGEDLSPWYTIAKGDQYIEFPDAHTWFDTTARRWVSDLEDPITPMKEEILRATRGE
jgi:hypothetical protein